jgi:glucose-1-phosphate cytidylyltransferase
MKVVILAGGHGTRLGEQTVVRPKPMVEIGSHPILWHIMKIYSYYGYNDFVILLGYKGYLIKEYFANYLLHQCDCTVDLRDNKINIINSSAEPWSITLLETGLNSMTGGRIKACQKYIGDEPFFLTYGDGVADIEIDKLATFHQFHGKVLTMTAVRPAGRFGIIDITDKGEVTSFTEKPKEGGGWINGGFFVCSPKVFEYIPRDSQCVFEQGPLENLARDSQLVAHRHFGFWRCMDTMREKTELEDLWNSGNAKWKVWG